ncbi:hypothetical protein KY289_017239 [Solanum tuberosum]|nr:hypothetical protein KY289_017239 [Solanum tuberosum]
MLGPIHPPPRFVITGGTLGIPGPNTLKNWFKIEKYEISFLQVKMSDCTKIGDTTVWLSIASLVLLALAK